MLGLKPSYLRKLAEQGKLPYYKPFGKMIYFLESDLDKLFENRIPSVEEILSIK